ncbi:MAG: hypothetical protein IID33_10615 [Planctomycetes bacterium]|nr:hypothetical protein [Planctomycetota bacterium]
MKLLSAPEMLEREFLQVRCRLIEIAAAMDRIDRSESADAAHSDPRMSYLIEGAAILHDGQRNRAERVQMVFSDAHDDAWRTSA